MRRKDALRVLEGLQPEAPAQHLASFADWKDAVAMAHAFLCRGDDGHAVGEETWVESLVRVAGLLLDSQDFGRPRGAIPDEWVNFVCDVARRPSTSPDGMVARKGGLRVPLHAWPSGLGASA